MYEYHFHLKCVKLGITNIHFADDFLLFSRGDEKSIHLLMEMFGQFSDATGLRANPSKCKIYFGGLLSMSSRRLHLTLAMALEISLSSIWVYLFNKESHY